VPEHQLDSIVKVGETSTVDLREQCPICCVASDMEGGLKNHIANHLERLACFSLPHGVADDDSDGASGVGTRGGSTTTGSSRPETITTSSRVSSRSRVSNSSLPRDIQPSPGQEQLSADALGTLPDATQGRVDVFLADEVGDVGIDQHDTDERLTNLSTEIEIDSPRREAIIEKDESLSSVSLSYVEPDDNGEGRLPILTASEIPTLHTLYRSRQLQQRDQSYAPNDSYNDIISYCYHDITRLRVDCIINSANRALKITRTNDSLNHIIHRCAGPGLQRECKAHGRIKAGAVALTSAYNLPSKYVMHAARPQYTGSPVSMGKFNVLEQCYRNALRRALDHDIKTIAFPCLGAGGCGFPPKVAARIALQVCKLFSTSMLSGRLF
jgi:O-acetyl-ADP-ribose deacetylase (regulator of RNase III)